MSAQNEALDRPSRPDWLRVLFWTFLAVAALGAGVAIAAGPSVGRLGSVLLIGLAACGLVFLLWVSRGAGAQVGLFPERGAAEKAAAAAMRAEYALLEALDEPALVTERSGAALAANSAYLDAAAAAGELGESLRPPAIDRLFGADPSLSAPMFRLAKAAGLGQARREDLPLAAFGPERALQRLEASVAPLSRGRVLWRLRPSAPGVERGASPQRAYLEDAPFGFMAVKSDGALAYANRALRAVLGVSENGVGALRLRDVVKEDWARLLRRDRRGFATQKLAVAVRARDGVDTRAVAWPTWASDEAGAGVYVFFDEGEAVTEAPRAAAGPAAALQFTQAVFEQAPFGAAVLDGSDAASATILEANPALMQMTQGKAAPGVALAELFDASEGPGALAGLLRGAADGAVELQLATHPPLAVHLQAARAAGLRTIAYVVNVTEQRELQQRLAQSEKMREIGTLAGGVAHDFNNLLMVVMQYTEFLMRRHPVGDPDYLDLSQINLHAQRAKELSEMLRAYARQQTFKREVIDVSEFVASTQELVRRLVGESIRFEVRHGRDLPPIKADRTQIERVLVNLASNARDAMISKDMQIARGGSLTMRTACVTAEEVRQLGHTPIDEGEYVLIEMADTGMGIKQEDQAKIFRPFHSTKEPGKGTGLGLATSYGIIKQSGGYIFFDSKVGRGTTFRILLPSYQPTAEEIEEIASRERAALERTHDVSGRGRILLVEDEFGVRQAIVRNLTECGFEVVEAENGEDALERLQEEPGAFDLILTDVSMPLMTGPEMLIAAGPELLGSAKVLFLSGYAPESFAAVLEAYPVSYLSKPVGATFLAQKVKELLAA
jgi:two-component system cell cycle sensor histidine kinase/response regulator CckA